MSRFQVGDTVTWTSQAWGSTKKKTGTVVIVVPAGVPPHMLVMNFAIAHGLREPDFGLQRDHESYVVSVPGGPKAKPKLYWPRVSALKGV